MIQAASLAHLFMILSSWCSNPAGEFGLERFGMSKRHRDNRCIYHPHIQRSGAFASKIRSATVLCVHILLWTVLCTLVSYMLVEGCEENVWQHRYISSRPLVFIFVLRRSCPIATSNLHPRVPTACCAFRFFRLSCPEPFRRSIVFATVHKGPIDVDVCGVVLLHEHAHVVFASQLSFQRCRSCEGFEEVQDDGANGGNRRRSLGQNHARIAMEGAVGIDGIRRAARTRHRTSRKWTVRQVLRRRHVRVRWMWHAAVRIKSQVQQRMWLACVLRQPRWESGTTCGSQLWDETRGNRLCKLWWTFGTRLRRRRVSHAHG